MNIFEKASLSLARSIRANYPEAASEEVLKFSLNILINTLSAILISLVVSAITGHLVDGVIVILGYILLRFFSGGVHLSSSITCCMLSIAIFVASTHISYSYWNFGFILDLASMVILLFTAPSGIDQVTRVSPKHYPVLKMISILIVSSNLFLQLDVLATSFFIQSLLTTSISYQVVEYLERRTYYEKNHR